MFTEDKDDPIEWLDFIGDISWMIPLSIIKKDWWKKYGHFVIEQRLAQKISCIADYFNIERLTNYVLKNNI